MTKLEEKVIRIIFGYGAQMVSEQTKLFLGSITTEEAEVSQGKITAETVSKILELIKVKK